MSALLAPRAVMWRIATVAELIQETPQAVTIVLDVPGWPGHVAGQHVDVRRATSCTARSSRRAGLTIHRTLTRERPEGWDGFDRRVDRAMLATAAPTPRRSPQAPRHDAQPPTVHAR